jgi:hypothetical protein
MTPSARARLRLEALLAALLDRVPAVTLGQLVERIARYDDGGPGPNPGARTWRHDGLSAFVHELAERLQPELVDEPRVPGDERARAELTVMDWSTVPVEVASELAYRLERMCGAMRGECFCGYHRSEG